MAEFGAIVSESTICNDSVGNGLRRRKMGFGQGASSLFTGDRYGFFFHPEFKILTKFNQLKSNLTRYLYFNADPNDVESPRNSFVMGNKLHLSQQPAPVSPNAEDLSLILGLMARGRSFNDSQSKNE